MALRRAAAKGHTKVVAVLKETAATAPPTAPAPGPAQPVAAGRVREYKPNCEYRQPRPGERKVILQWKSEEKMSREYSSWDQEIVFVGSHGVPNPNRFFVLKRDASGNTIQGQRLGHDDPNALRKMFFKCVL